MFVESGTQPVEPTEPVEEEVTEPVETEPTEEVKPEVEPKTFDEEYVKGLRRENAKYRTRARDAEARSQQPYVNQFGQQIDPQTGLPVSPQAERPYYSNQPNQGQPNQGQVYDPRVDDMMLSNKMNEIKADPYFSELFKETNDEGITFEERVLEKAVETSWPIEELDALVFKMEKTKLMGGVKQKGVDEAYKSMSDKAKGSAEKNVSSGKNVEAGKVDTIDDAVKAAMKEHGVTDLSNLG